MMMSFQFHFSIVEQQATLHRCIADSAAVAINVSLYGGSSSHELLSDGNGLIGKYALIPAPGALNGGPLRGSLSSTNSMYVLPPGFSVNPVLMGTGHLDERAPVI